MVNTVGIAGKDIFTKFIGLPRGLVNKLMDKFSTEDSCLSPEEYELLKELVTEQPRTRFARIVAYFKSNNEPKHVFMGPIQASNAWSFLLRNLDPTRKLSPEKRAKVVQVLKWIAQEDHKSLLQYDS